jgi:hypothetical protein
VQGSMKGRAVSRLLELLFPSLPRAMSASLAPSPSLAPGLTKEALWKNRRGCSLRTTHLCDALLQSFHGLHGFPLLLFPEPRTQNSGH